VSTRTEGCVSSVSLIRTGRGNGSRRPTGGRVGPLPADATDRADANVRLTSQDILYFTLNDSRSGTGKADGGREVLQAK